MKRKQAASDACGFALIFSHLSLDILSRLILLTLALAACVHSSRALRPPHRASYWEALAELHPLDAIAAARTESEKEFAEALGNLMAGDLENAEHRFDKLRRAATDSVIRAASRVTYTATLQYRNSSAQQTVQNPWFDRARALLSRYLRARSLLAVAPRE